MQTEKRTEKSKRRQDITLVCDNCHQDYHPLGASLRERAHHFCSKRCYAAYKVGKTNQLTEPGVLAVAVREVHLPRQDRLLVLAIEKAITLGHLADQVAHLRDEMARALGNIPLELRPEGTTPAELPSAVEVYRQLFAVETDLHRLKSHFQAIFTDRLVAS